jgi:hypothetical protein
MLFGSFAVHVCFVTGLARGLNWIRWCFVVVAAPSLLLQFYCSVVIFGPIIIGAPPPLPMYIGIAVWIGYSAAVVLCLTQSANAYFRQKPTPPLLTPVIGPSAAGAIVAPPSGAADRWRPT